MLEILEDAWQYVINYPEKLAGYTLEHIWIIFVAIAIAIILGVSVGVYITGKGK
jgi:ABC-type proline/glycine betaine transport system permease subunit